MDPDKEPTRCESCGQIIPDTEDVIEYEYKLYCPTCYSKKISGRPSSIGIIMTIISIIMLVCLVILWVI